MSLGEGRRAAGGRISSQIKARYQTSTAFRKRLLEKTISHHVVSMKVSRHTRVSVSNIYDLVNNNHSPSGSTHLVQNARVCCSPG